MRIKKQEGFINEHLAGFIVFTAYLSLFGLDCAWRAFS